MKKRTSLKTTLNIADYISLIFMVGAILTFAVALERLPGKETTEETVASLMLDVSPSVTDITIEELATEEEVVISSIPAPDDRLMEPLSAFEYGQMVPETADDRNTYNGYWWSDGWVPGLITLDTQFLRLPPVTIGSALFYAPQAMEANVEYRGLPYDDTYYVGAVAVPFCSEIGHPVWLKHPDRNEWEGPFLVADCSRRNDLYGHIMYRDQVVEVDFETARRWNMARFTTTNDKGWMAISDRVNGVLMSTLPPENFDGTITDLSVWFPSVVRYAEITELYHKVQNVVPPGYDGTTGGGLGIKNPSDTLPMWLLNNEWVIFE